MAERYDFLVIGAGIVGLTLALEIKRRRPDARIVILEKEPEPGRHSSGRNSGVLHSGIYYPPASIKAQVCGQGAREMAAYCQERGLPLNPIGKILVPVNDGDGAQLDMLEQRGPQNGVTVRRLDRAELARLEPEAGSATGEALLVAQTSVVSSQAVLASIVDDVRNAGIEIRCGGTIEAVDARARTIVWGSTTIAYDHVFNTAGLHADTVAHRFGVGKNFTLLPFKGLYWKLDPAAGFTINHLIYPVPDLRVPFLGVHTTTAIDGTVYIGPTSVPGFGRENYHGLDDVRPVELVRILSHLAGQYIAGRNGFRRLAWQEGRRYFKPWFAEAARKILPRLRPEHLLPCDKVGIRAQMLDKRSGELVTDFLVEAGPHSTHVLNAISPAFTSAFPLARRLADFANIT
ncbi:L-2-hydroxyglutarate oxidase [Sphingorhabdus soli]|uniref:L-2-hydroxyglutarate oxidase n=1 Tax=Flavisphingopyxis soli TaxID=2601267 RepID=A0A5C6UTG9_9SPHN|nr:L-2-hydroxyglutarate oxidase [Sphingorhabdus soli]TXC74238.1 L-2-hydroxyglutarate oxidase [Sphingorhabdus soli]